jgi:hypothetical protein
MTIWISLPTSVVPKSIKLQDTQKVDAWYKRICLSFEHRIDLPPDNLRLPQSVGVESEDIAACAINKLLEKSENGSRKLGVGMLIDCRSSAAIGGSAPTYKLAKKAGLRTSLPFSLAGQSGSEVGQAINFLQNFQWDQVKVVVISAVQRVVPPDSRLFRQNLPLADAAAAIIVARFPMPFIRNFRVLSVVSSQSENGQDPGLNNIFQRVVEKAKISSRSIKWSILHSLNRELENSVHADLPETTWLSRRSNQTVDFGCADVLVSLQQLSLNNSILCDGIGVLWFYGRFGAIIAVSVDSRPLS